MINVAVVEVNYWLVVSKVLWPVTINVSLHVLLVLLWVVVQSCLLCNSSDVVLSFCVIAHYVFPEVVIMYDIVSRIFLTMVFIVSAMVFIYSYRYISHNISASNFLITLALFCGIMVLLSLSGDVFWMIVGWDGLGFTSFCLIVFFQNWKAISGGLVTFLCNRFGDLFIICSIGWLLIFDSTFKCVADDNTSLNTLSTILLFGAISNSAQLPFSAWLPMAMAAPTPVSSLVHSSTLVTAGVFLVCRFYPIFDEFVLFILYIVSSLTIIVAGSSSLYEWDLKNVIALSTLIHVSIMLNTISLGGVDEGLFHMVIHAFFKSILFIGAGIVIHSSSNWQDLRRSGWSESGVSWLMIQISLISMAGLPFLSGFYSKEKIIYTVSLVELSVASVPFWFGVVFTLGYSSRILIYTLSIMSSVTYSLSNGVFCLSVSIISCMCSSIGGVLLWYSHDFSFLPVNIIDSLSNTCLLAAVVTGVLVGIFSVWSSTNLSGTSGFMSQVGFLFINMSWKCDSFVYFWVENYCKWSWFILNFLDVNGVLGETMEAIVSLVTEISIQARAILITWPVLVVKIFLTVFIVLWFLSNFMI